MALRNAADFLVFFALNIIGIFFALSVFLLIAGLFNKKITELHFLTFRRVNQLVFVATLLIFAVSYVILKEDFWLLLENKFIAGFVIMGFLNLFYCGWLKKDSSD